MKRKMLFMISLVLILPLVLAGCSSTDDTIEPDLEEDKEEVVVNFEYDGYGSISKFIGSDDLEILTLEPWNTSDNRIFVADDAFRNGLKNVKKVIIPSTTVWIGKGAFADNENLEEIVFEENSQLEELSELSFSLLPNVKKFTVPNSVTKIRENTFLNSGITEIVGNERYPFRDGMLLDNYSSGTANAAIYIDPTLTTVTFPDYVEYMGDYLFCNNKNIQTVDLNKVTSIFTNTFKNSTLKTLLNYENVTYATIEAFENTPFLNENDEEYIIMGTMLLKYNGNDTIINIPENVTKIGDFAFASDLITEVNLHDKITSIGFSFSECPNVEIVRFYRYIPPFGHGYFVSAAKFYVANLNGYKSNILFAHCENEIYSLDDLNE